MESPTSQPRKGRKIRPGLWIEYLFVVLILAGLINTAHFFVEYGFLLAPYFYEPNGTFTDWFSLTFWAHHPGAYDVERSIYPPLSFLIMRLFSDSACYPVQGLEVRYCDLTGIYALCGMYVLTAIAMFWTFYRFDRGRAFPRAFAMAFGLPLTYSLERGNFVMLCSICVLLAFGPALRSARLRWFFAGIAINFKVYLIGAALAPLLRRRWAVTEGMLIAAVLVYGFTWFIFGAGDPRVLYHNVVDFSDSYSIGNPSDLWYPSSYQPLLAALGGYTLPVLMLLGSRTVENMYWYLHLYVQISQFAIIAGAVATWLRPEVVPPHRVVAFAISLTLMSSEAGGYTEILLLPFVFMESWRGWARPTALVLTYVLCIPIEYVISPLPSGIVRDSFLSQRYVTVYYGLGLGSLLRPGLTALITNILAAVTIHDVWQDMRTQGWSQRWRFRKDWAIPHGIRRPRAPIAKAARLGDSREMDR